MKVVDKRGKFIIVNKSLIEEQDNGITKPSEISVFTALCMHADNDTGKSWPSLETIAVEGRVSERTARNAIKALESAGYIRVVSRFDEETGRQLSNYYYILKR